jgi:FMN phosphatase YigB (HAD superfamily)
MKISKLSGIKFKKLVVFDLDGTLGHFFRKPSK